MSLFSKKEDPGVQLSTTAPGDEDKRYGESGADLDALIAATYSNMQLLCLQKYKHETSNVRFYWGGCISLKQSIQTWTQTKSVRS